MGEIKRWVFSPTNITDDWVYFRSHHNDQLARFPTMERFVLASDHDAAMAEKDKEIAYLENTAAEKRESGDLVLFMNAGKMTREAAYQLKNLVEALKNG